MTADEIMDIVDDHDTVIGQASRSEIYQKFLQHRIVHIFIKNKENKIWLQLRSKNASYCPEYRSTTVWWHIQTWENYKEAALREYKEELWITSELKFLAKDIYKDYQYSKFLGTFITEYNGDFKFEENAVDDVKFFTVEEIKDMIKNWEKFHPELLFLLEKYFI